MTNEFEIRTLLNEALDQHRQNTNTQTEPERFASKTTIKALRSDLQALLTEGAEECPDCQCLPIGIRQPTYMEIGCTSQSCRDHRSKGIFIEEAIQNWNAQIFFSRPPITQPEEE